eukprot:CAMPEP_0170303550 /NCGR_PEP_ID=MMETSP0116_2-20130129/52097_1 /TAXON_ID=400756 /ORGANISM="Durinskia baltica, Strain CSIRO CS-38" /LENGTH=111 /DNA_ID=CAMNT_0010555497 /DNA_START=10 /DNA_END=341 /DNA_ORIENTATION=+
MAGVLPVEARRMRLAPTAQASSPGGVHAKDWRAGRIDRAVYAAERIAHHGSQRRRPTSSQPSAQVRVGVCALRPQLGAASTSSAERLTVKGCGGLACTKAPGCTQNHTHPA